MVFAYILAELDRELDRLGRLRAIIAGLKQTSPVVALNVGTPATVSEPEKPKPVRHRSRLPRLASRPALDRIKTRPESRALSATIPTGPVVIPAAVVRELQSASPPAASTAELAPEALLKELTQRWIAGGSVAGGR